MDNVLNPEGFSGVVIQPSRGWGGLPLGEVWRFRELVFFLVWRDLKVRYRQSVLGALWIIIQPLVTMAVFSLIFNRFLGIDSGNDVPYPVFSYTALLPWMYFSNSLSRCSNSLVGNAALISKIYFPRLIVPLSAVLPGLVDFLIAFVILLGMLLYYGIWPGWAILTLPLLLLLAMITTLGVGLWLSALNVQYRDVQYITPFLIQVWMYATPIIYSTSRIPERWLWLYNLNPMVGVVQSFRRILLNDQSFGGVSWPSLAIALVILVSGLIYFRQTERIFADVV
ncbi:MAG: ABC transporter permease [Anaerolineae bacterium]|nr:ABC transporter permease [Anaerolineae bacterium]